MENKQDSGSGGSGLATPVLCINMFHIVNLPAPLSLSQFEFLNRQTLMMLNLWRLQKKKKNQGKMSNKDFAHTLKNLIKWK